MTTEFIRLERTGKRGRNVLVARSAIQLVEW